MYAADLLRVIRALKKMPIDLKYVCGDLYVDGAPVPISPRSSHVIVHLRDQGAHERTDALQKAMHDGGFTLRLSPMGFEISLSWKVGDKDAGFEIEEISAQGLEAVEAHYEDRLLVEQAAAAVARTKDDAFLQELKDVLLRHGASLSGDSGCCGDASINLPSGKSIDTDDLY